MDLVAEVAAGLEEADDLSTFRVRDQPPDAEVLAQLEYGSGTFIAKAEIVGALPVLAFQLPGASEAMISLRLRSLDKGGVDYRFHSGPSNPVMTIAAWAATVDECARTVSGAADFVLPTVNGLTAMVKVWEGLGMPPGVGVRDGIGVDQIVAQAVAAKITAA